MTDAVAEVLLPKADASKLAPSGGGPSGGRAVAERLLRSAVWVATDQGNGSGIVVGGGSRPLVVTNHHVVAGARAVTVFFPDYSPDKREIGSDQHYLTNKARLARTRPAQAARVYIPRAVKDKGAAAQRYNHGRVSNRVSRRGPRPELPGRIGPGRGPNHHPDLGRLDHQ